MAGFEGQKTGRVAVDCLDQYRLQVANGVEGEIYNAQEHPGYSQVVMTGDGLRSCKKGIQRWSIVHEGSPEARKVRINN